MHCTTHAVECADGGHLACSNCALPCSLCGRRICDSHALKTFDAAPRGQRRLCGSCVVFCEGGSNEPVGRDEVARCASCDRFVCGHHQAVCAVDGKVHCSRHLRRTDGSRRLICEQHRSSCAFERHTIFAADETTACCTCGNLGCKVHVGLCSADGRTHCHTDLLALSDVPGARACVEHRSICHIDSMAFSPNGTVECPVCSRRACASHTVSCPNCARTVCSSDQIDGAKPLCRTCGSLAELHDPSNHVVRAAVALRGDAGMPGRWRQATDGAHIVVEMDFGWKRKTVFTLRHDGTGPVTVVRHSLLGAKIERIGE